VPGATMQKLGAEIRGTFKRFKNEPFEFLKREVARTFSVLAGSKAITFLSSWNGKTLHVGKHVTASWEF
jgi:hypothetical protein